MDFFKKAFRTASELSIFLLIGTVAALFWANIDIDGYREFIDGPLFGLQFFADLEVHGKPFSFHFLINDIFMAFFFGIAMKEVSESFLPGGPLSSVRKAALPAISTLGGVFGPIGVFVLCVTLFTFPISSDQVMHAWAVPTATDIAYCWLFARLIFGNIHPAVTYLLVLAVLDDLIGMMIIATFYTEHVHFQWLGLVLAAIVVCEVLRRLGVRSFWPYALIGGTLSWFGLYMTGVHAALAFVPVVPFMPHAERDAGLFAESEPHDDTMNRFEHFFKPFVDTGLIFFGLANAGVLLNAESLTGTATWSIFLALLVGKTFGIWLFTLAGTKAGLDLPEHMDMKVMTVVGCVAGIGFTVALFVVSVAYDAAAAGDDLLAVIDMLKLGALLSFAAGPIAAIMARVMGIEKLEGEPPDPHAHH